MVAVPYVKGPRRHHCVLFRLHAGNIYWKAPGAGEEVMLDGQYEEAEGEIIIQFRI